MNVSEMAQDRIRQNTYKRLRDLPAVISLSELQEGLGVSENVARVSAARWSAAGLLSGAGTRCGYYYNLVAEPDAADTRRGELVAQMFGSAVLVGPSVLHAAGWTTQIPQTLTIAVPRLRSYPQLRGITLHPRPSYWFELVEGACAEMGYTDTMSQTLPPEWALADMLVHAETRHGLRPDDVELPVEKGTDELMRALDAFHVQDDVFEPWLRASGLAPPAPTA